MNISLKQTLKDKDYNISKNITSDSYQFSIYYNDTNSTETYQFTLISNGQEIEYMDNNQNIFVYSKRN